MKSFTLYKVLGTTFQVSLSTPRHHKVNKHFLDIFQHSPLSRKVLFTTPNLSLKCICFPLPKDFVRMSTIYSSVDMYYNSTAPL